MMQKEIVQPVSADTGAIEQSADNPSPCAPLTPSAETRYLKAMEQTDRYHCRYNPSYALLDNAEPAPVIPAAGVRPRTHSVRCVCNGWRPPAPLIPLQNMPSATHIGTRHSGY